MAAPALVYVTDTSLSIRRTGSPSRFRYVDARGRPVRAPKQLRRIRALVIPPAWTDVWICPNPRGHIQAVGRDARGRKQYRYHSAFREARDRDKYERMLEFGKVLPRLRQALERDLARRGLSREKVLATVVHLLELTHARVGNEEYARKNESFGLTTLRNKHVAVEGSSIEFRFRGKSGKEHTLSVVDRRIARIVRRCEELPGQQLFEYVDENGDVQAVESSDVNEYIRRASGGDFTAKDYRTLAGTVLAARVLREAATHRRRLSAAERKRVVDAAVRYVARRLGNTVATCRKCYIHPCVIDAFMEERLGADHADLHVEERAVFRLVSKKVLPAATVTLAEVA